MEDGFLHYMVNKGSWIAYDAYEAGKTYEQAQKEVLAFWDQYKDRLEVTPRSDGSYKLTFEGVSVFLSIPVQDL